MTSLTGEQNSNPQDPNLKSSHTDHTFLKEYVGFDLIKTQIEKKFIKRGFQLNVLLVGESGLGKSTFINSLFGCSSNELTTTKGRKLPSEPINKTTKIEAVSHNLVENDVKLKLTIVDTPGYGDRVNNSNCWEPIITYIKDQHGIYLKKELTALRERFIQDTRIHVCLYFISPTGHSLKPIDITVLKKLVSVVNVVPVIAKSDSLTSEERKAFKKRIKSEFEYHEIKIYPYLSEEDDEQDREINNQIQEMIPFAIVGSTEKVTLDGEEIRGRKNRSGIINILDESHCEFINLRNMLTRSHLQDLIETTQYKHYESFRREQILAFSNSSKNSQAQNNNTSSSAHQTGKKQQNQSTNKNRMTTVMDQQRGTRK